jgi:signal transduction histidine kinase
MSELVKVVNPLMKELLSAVKSGDGNTIGEKSVEITILLGDKLAEEDLNKNPESEFAELWMEVKELSLKEVVENAVKANAKSLIGNKIKIKIENLDQKIFSDEKWVLFILNQVISNAIKYKKEEAEISFCARCEKNEILLEIRDNGIGISPKDLPRITDKGYTGTTGRNYQKSTGMGLYLCKKLCSKLQLSFYIESKEEEYTKVTIGFPRNSMIFLNEE